MLFPALLPSLVGALSLSSVAAAAHSDDHLMRRAPHRRVASEVAQKRAVNLNAPHYSLYLYDGVSSGNWPTADKVSPFNRVLLAFWLTSGSHASATEWAGLSDSKRQEILNSYHDAGIAVMVSAFGDGDHVITDKKDPIQVAQSLAGFVKQNSLDGVDIDFEDFTALQNDKANALDWLTKFHTELRNQLPSGQYAISSTPTAWVYGASFGGADSVYCKLHAAVGNTISWYNMQFYNGEPNTWDTCEHLMWKSADPGFLSLNEISTQCGIPLSQIAVGKLWDTAELAKPVPAQIPAPADFGACLAQAKAQISYPQTGVMIWYGSMSNWDGAISYLSGTLSAMDSAPAVAPVASSETPASSAGASGSAAAPAAGSSAAPSGSPAPSSDTSAAAGAVPSGASAAPSSANSPQAAPAAADSSAGTGAGAGSAGSNTPSGTASPASAQSANPGSSASALAAPGLIAVAFGAVASFFML